MWWRDETRGPTGDYSWVGGSIRIAADTPEACLIVPDFAMYKYAVHVIINFVASFLLHWFLFLINDIPKPGWEPRNRMRKKIRENKAKKERVA